MALKDCKITDGVCERHTPNNPECLVHLESLLEPEGWEPPEEVTAMEFLVLAGAEPGKAAEALEDYYDQAADQILARKRTSEAPKSEREEFMDSFKASADPLPQTLAEAYKRGAEDMAVEMSKCCGCSGPQVMINPYDGSEF